MSDRFRTAEERAEFGGKVLGFSIAGKDIAVAISAGFATNANVAVGLLGSYGRFAGPFGALVSAGYGLAAQGKPGAVSATKGWAANRYRRRPCRVSRRSFPQRGGAVYRCGMAKRRGVDCR